jgi:hypothetical protein
METTIGTIAKTGEECPESGDWKVLDQPSTIIRVDKGNFMPPLKGRSVQWELVKVG